MSIPRAAATMARPRCVQGPPDVASPKGTKGLSPRRNHLNVGRVPAGQAPMKHEEGGLRWWLDRPLVRRHDRAELIEPRPTRLDGHDQVSLDRPREVDPEAHGTQTANRSVPISWLREDCPEGACVRCRLDRGTGFAGEGRRAGGCLGWPVASLANVDGDHDVGALVQVTVWLVERCRRP